MISYGLQSIDEDDIEEVVKVLKSDYITTGPKVAEFEKAICGYIGCKHAVVVSTGTSALDIAVQALELPAGAEVITTPFTFVATSNALLYNGLTPVFADIEKDTRNISPDDIRKKITDKTKAIIYVDYAGHPCKIDEIREIAREHGLFLIEDACHAFGAEYHGKKAGNFADMTVFSFHPVKHITTGEGGAVVTGDERLNEKLRILRNHGMDKESKDRSLKGPGYIYDIRALGKNYRLTDIQCALGISQLKKIDLFIEKRQKLARLYNETLEGFDKVERPMTFDGIRHAWHIYTVLLSPGVDRDDFFRFMREHDVGVNVHYIPIYRFSYYQKLYGIDPAAFPATEDVYGRIVTLPLHTRLTEGEVSYICDTVKSYF